MIHDPIFDSSAANANKKEITAHLFAEIASAVLQTMVDISWLMFLSVGSFFENTAMTVQNKFNER